MAEPFKAIIIGAGPVGLCAAHALGLAGIDFVVLERRDTVAKDVGASLVLSPSGLRVMQQFGLLETLQKIGGELQRAKTFHTHGHELADRAEYQILKANHGLAPTSFHRAQLVQAIYDGLPPESKEKILLRRRIADMSTDDDGVSVTCEDGVTYRGSIIIGADGVNSQTRHYMRKHALASDPQQAWDAEMPFESEYRCGWAAFPRPKGSPSGDNFETEDKDRSVMYISGAEKAWIFLYEKLPAKTSAKVSYTEAEAEAFAETFAEYPLTQTLKVKDALANRLTIGMANLEEGIAKNWSFGRMVLVGDACHKFTPNAGMGFNSGIQDVAALGNLLHRPVQSGEKLEVPALEVLFRRYQDSRQDDLAGLYQLSAGMTRRHARATVWQYLMARLMATPLANRLIINWVAAPKIAQQLVLDYVEVQDGFRGAVPWVHQMGVSG